jgi:hypothetical protein
MAGKGISQNEAILRHLKAGGSITPLEALRYFDCMRLGARIHDLRELGHNIQVEYIRTAASQKRIARYTLQA